MHGSSGRHSTEEWSSRPAATAPPRPPRGASHHNARAFAALATSSLAGPLVAARCPAILAVGRASATRRATWLIPAWRAVHARASERAAAGPSMTRVAKRRGRELCDGIMRSGGCCVAEPWRLRRCPLAPPSATEPFGYAPAARGRCRPRDWPTIRGSPCRSCRTFAPGPPLEPCPGAGSRCVGVLTPARADQEPSTQRHPHGVPLNRAPGEGLDLGTRPAAKDRHNLNKLPPLLARMFGIVAPPVREQHAAQNVIARRATSANETRAPRRAAPNSSAYTMSLGARAVPKLAPASLRGLSQPPRLQHNGPPSDITAPPW